MHLTISEDDTPLKTLRYWYYSFIVIKPRFFRLPTASVKVPSMGQIDLLGISLEIIQNYINAFV